MARRRGLEPDDVESIHRLLSWHRDLLERYQRLNEVVDTVDLRLDSLEQTLSEWFEKTSELIEARTQRMEELLLLYASGRGRSDRAEELREDIRTEHDQTHLRRLLVRQKKNLQRYREREAEYAGEAPVFVLNKIEELEASITTIRKELGLDE